MKNFHITHYKGKNTVILKYEEQYYLLIGKNDRRKRLRRKAIIWGAKMIKNPDCWQKPPGSKQFENAM